MSNENNPKLSVDEYVRTTSFQDFVLEYDINPFKYKTRYVQIVTGKEDKLQEALADGRDRLYEAAQKLNAVAVVGVNHNVIFKEGTYSDGYKASYVGMAVIPKEKLAGGLQYD